MYWDWVSQNKMLIQWISIVSIISFFGSIIIIPKIIINLSSDFFINGKNPRMDDQNLLIRIVFSLIKNALGFLLFLCVIIMLFIPGQGLLTMFLGLVLMDIPGKHRLQLYFLRLRAVQKSLNWIRNKNGAPPFIYND